MIIMEKLLNMSLSLITSLVKRHDKVMFGTAKWQNRMLDKIYPIVYMDAVNFKVRDEYIIFK